AGSPSPRSASRHCRSRAIASTVSAWWSKRSGWPRASRARPPPAIPASQEPPTLAVTLLDSLRTLMSVGLGLRELFPRPAPAPAQDDPLTLELLRRADEARAGGRPQEAGTLYRQILQTRRGHLGALRGCRELAVEAGEWRQVLDLQHRILGAVGASERAAEVQPALPLLARLERAYRQEGRPTRMIALYRTAIERAPDDLSLAVALGRVFFELEMLDEAADQFEKVEVQAPDLPAVHAFLGAVFERRGETRVAFAEYRRALQLARAFDWPHRCDACGATAAGWQDRCEHCR